MAFLATVNNHGFGRGVAPPGGKEPRIGTNPLCVGIPTNGDPVVLPPFAAPFPAAPPVLPAVADTALPLRSLAALIRSHSL